MFRRSLLAVTALLPIAAWGLSAHAQAPELHHRPGSDRRSLYLRTGRVDLRQRPSVLASDASFNADTHYIIQLDGPITPQLRDALEKAGVVLDEYLPMYAYLADLSRVRADALAGIGEIVWVGAFDPAWKLCPKIGTQAFETAERGQLEAAGMKRLTVLLFSRSDVGRASDNLVTCGATLRDVSIRGDDCQIEIEIPADRIEELRQVAEVMFVEESPEGRPRNSTTAWITQTNVTNDTRLWDMGLHGENQMAGVIDWNLVPTHCAFDDPEGDPFGPNHRKIEAYYGGGGCCADHATHVCGVLAGDDPALSDPNLRGQAYACRLVFTNQPTEVTSVNLFERLEIHHNDGASVHSNSWGNSSRDYIDWSRDIDDFTRVFEDDLVLVAVTNPNIQVQAPENAKNVLAVAATNDTPSQDTRCLGGFGPTLDGRQKPEVWAPGCSSQSADWFTACGVRIGGGTSFACPAVAAMGILTRQYFTEGFYPTGGAVPADAFTPSGALLKAALINSAVDMSGFADYFSVNEGWGRVLMDDALHFTGDSRKLIVQDVRNVDGLSTGETDTFVFSVNSSFEPLTITVVWTDVPAALLAAFTPVNNLDLVVTDPGAVSYLGNVFSGVQSATGGSADLVNNGEQVHRTSPVAGLWQVDITGAAVNQAAQGYALVITGDVVACGKGDVNGDGLINGLDIAGFVQVLLSGGTAAQECAADMNGAAGAGLDDLDAFVAALLTGAA